MTWELEPHRKLILIESVLPKEEETLILIAKAKLATGVRTGGEKLLVRGEGGFFILTSYRVIFVGEVEGLVEEPESLGQIPTAPKLNKVRLNVPLVYFPELQEHPTIYKTWQNHMNLVLETADAIQEIAYLKATGELLDFRRTSHDFFKRCFKGPIDFKVLIETGVKHSRLEETEIYKQVGQRIEQHMTTVPESLLQSYRKKVQSAFISFIQFLRRKGQGGYYDPVARTTMLRGGHVHISLDGVAQSSNSRLQQKVQLLIEEWRAEEEAKRERLGDRYEITGF